MMSFQRIILVFSMLVLVESGVPCFPRCRFWPRFRPSQQVPAGEKTLGSDHVFCPPPNVVRNKYHDH